MPIELLAVGIFLVVAVGLIVLFPGKNLDEIMLLDGEEPLFDEKGIVVEERPARGETTRHIRSRVIVTNRRMIVAQLPLFSKKYMISMVLYRRGPGAPEKTGLEGRIKTGILEPASVRVVDQGKPRDHGVEIQPTGFSMFNRESTTLLVRSEQPAALKKALVAVAKPQQES